MFWFASISTILVFALALRFVHAAKCSKRVFYASIICLLVLFNAAITSIIVTFLIDESPWIVAQSLLAVLGIAFALATLLRFRWPPKFNHFPEHKILLTKYTAIFLGIGLIGGSICAIPVAIRTHYIFESDRWADIGTAIVLFEITSLYSLALALMLAIGMSIPENKAKWQRRSL